MNTRPPLTPKQQQVFEYIQSYFDEHGLPPSFVEIQTQMGASSVNSAKQFIDHLIGKGYLLEPKEKNSKRAIQIHPFHHRHDDVVSIKLAGVVAAGYPLEAIEQQDHIEVPRQFLGRDIQKNQTDYFALKVKGDSMIEDCIMEGDLVIIRSQSTATNGQTVVAIVDNEATIKRYYKKKTHIELHPANPSFKIIKVEEKAQFKILGVLSTVIRKMET